MGEASRSRVVEGCVGFMGLGLRCFRSRPHVQPGLSLSV